MASAHPFGHLILIYLQSGKPFTFMAYCDIGEMFLNFMLSEEFRSFCGLDITNVST